MTLGKFVDTRLSIVAEEILMTPSQGARRLSKLHKEWTYPQLGKFCGINPNTVRRYARGERMPRLEEAVKMEDELGIQVRSWLKK